MKKTAGIALSLLLFSILALAGCGSNQEVSNGVNEMLKTTDQLAKSIDSGDQARVKGTGPKLAEQWKKIEDKVKKDHQDLYEKIEKYLDPTVAGSQAASLDKQALGNLNKQLAAALKELAAKLK